MTANPAAIGQAGRAHAAMLVFTVLISTSFPVGAAITHALDPAALTCLRFAIAAVVLFAVVRTGQRVTLPRPADFGRYALIGLAPAIYFVAMFEALRWTGPVSTGAIFTLVPAMTAVVAFALVGQRSPTRLKLCLALGAAGALWVVFEGSLQALIAVSLGKGEWIFFAGCLGYSFYAPLMRKLHRGEPQAVFTFWVLVSGTLMMAAYGWRALLATDWAGLAPEAYLGIAYLACFPTAMSFFLAQYASLRLPSAKVMAYTYLIPGLVVIWQALLGQGWPAPSVAAGILVVTAVTVVLQRTRA